MSRLVAQNLQVVEEEEEVKKEHPVHVESRREGFLLSLLKTPLRAASRLTAPTRGTTPFLLTLGEGMNEVPNMRLAVSAITIGLSYFIGGLIPIIPYLCVIDALHGLYWSIVSFVLTVSGLLIFPASDRDHSFALRFSKIVVYGGR